jgi:hypothetical protein
MIYIVSKCQLICKDIVYVIAILGYIGESLEAVTVLLPDG